MTKRGREPQSGYSFRITSGKGFHITFKNGWTVSVQFGGGNYADNYDAEIGGERSSDQRSTCAEVAVWGPDRGMIDLGGDTVRGWQTPAAVLALLNAAESGALAQGVVPPEEREVQHGQD